MTGLHNKGALLVLLLLPMAGWCSVDGDGDGVPDLVDNCVESVNSPQRDTDGDGIGNLCDPDFNNDGIVDLLDLAEMRDVFLLQGVFDQDLNGDAIVDLQDLAVMRPFFLDSPGPAGALVGGLELTPVFTTVALSFPMAMKQAPGDATQWYVAERSGRLLRFDNVEAPAAAVEVLDISDRVDTFFEGGLLDFAFDPSFQDNGRVYMSYTATGANTQTNPLDSRLSSFTLDPGSADGAFDPDSEVIILEYDQPYGNHNGGGIEFGPDGYIYLALGDGGSGGDPEDNGQDKTTLAGAILRLDLELTPADIAAGLTYRIPPGNPFIESEDCSTGCPEIYAWGFRNPWRFSFDRVSGELYAGDVGQDSVEEVDLVTAGGNYGWRCYEGSLVYETFGCGPMGDYTFPIQEYSHTDGRSITGGFVYRGGSLPALDGVYLYGDYVNGRIWGLLGSNSLGELVDTNLRIVSFVESAAGELYVLGLFSGSINRIGLPE